MTEQKTADDNDLYENPEDMSDEDLADEYKSFYLQIENDLPRFTDEGRRFMELSAEVARREHLEVLESVRVLRKDGRDTEVLEE